MNRLSDHKLVEALLQARTRCEQTAAEAEVANAARDDVIRTALATGWSQREVAGLAGLSHTQVANVRRSQRSPD